jgi:thioredoxin 1
METGKVKQVSDMGDFKNIINSNAHVIVDFFATWCGPCKTLAPQLDQMARENPQVCFLKIDVDEADDIASEYGISAMPTVHIFNTGKIAKTVVGVNPSVIQHYISANTGKFKFNFISLNFFLFFTINFILLF